MASLMGNDGNKNKEEKKMVRKLWWLTFIMLTMGSLLIMIRGAMLAI